MKSKKLLFSTLLLLGGVSTYIMLGSHSTGMTGLSTSGCGGTGCHASGSGTTISIAGVPLSGYTAGTTYSITLSVMNSTKVAAGFDLTVSSGTISGVPANTMVMGGVELHHLSSQLMSSGVSTWVFNWTAPVTGSSVTFNVAGNAVNNTGNESGDTWTTKSVIFNKAIPTSVQTTEVTSFSLYPNPVSDLIHMRLDNPTELSNFEAIDFNGRAVSMDAVKESVNNYHLSTSSLPTGNYILRFAIEGRLYSCLFTKK